MKKTIKLFAIIALAAGVGFITSCQKQKLNKDTTSSEDDAMAESMFDDVFKVVDESAKDEGLDKLGMRPYTFGSQSGCAAITIVPDIFDTLSWPKTLTVDFGTEGCTGDDGRVRKGKIIAVFTGRYRDEGTIITVTTENYFVNDHEVLGTKTVINEGRNNDGNLWYSIDVNGMVITPEAKEITWVSAREREWIEGEETTWVTNGIDGILDDAYSITGNGSGVNRKGRAFTVEITTALRVQFCGWIPEVTKGVIKLIPEDLKIRTVDFGDGTCDNEAVATIGKRTYRFKLR